MGKFLENFELGKNSLKLKKNYVLRLNNCHPRKLKIINERKNRANTFNISGKVFLTFRMVLLSSLPSLKFI